ncbi:POK25 protein, partial [Fregata magnificens]|nr:POK25 protein [Fregata magnificens]
PLVIIDLRDCFFTIPLHPDDAPWFAFSVPAINNHQPMKRYHWAVLPQGMLNSPTICQLTVARILETVSQQLPQILIYHHMDDILVSGADKPMVKEAVQSLH